MAEANEEAPRKRRPSFWLRPLWWLNGLSALVLLITYPAPHISPDHFWPLALLAMAYPFQVLVQAGFIVLWLLFRRKRMLLPITVLLLGYGHIADHFKLFGRQGAPQGIEVPGVKLMSWNVRLFDLYNWSGNRVTRDAIFDVLLREDADILCLQEFFHSDDERFFRTREPLLKDLRYRHLHEHYGHEARFGQRFGIATFSAWPVVDRGTITFEANPNNLCIWSDIALPGDTIRVYNAHLGSYHFGDDDYKFIGELDTDTKGEELRRGGLRILRLLRRGLRQRAAEVERIAAHMAGSPHPVVFCGDINDVPMSYGYHMLRKDRCDAFRESGRGRGGTYVGALPSLRIDHILHDDAIASWGFVTHPEELSDHRAISCMIAPRP
ncbi:MAG: endonuclease/exonuclease/phosphatase family protein [Anaerolineae bacterium]|nr:endonuclease/exonuclease/phosphatase family protein [Anaerolineae bacterium]MCW5898023.1 endonuclease/exonuclease/phosphatase family protein [Flavobacteriales bacterium]